MDHITIHDYYLAANLPKSQYDKVLVTKYKAESEEVLKSFLNALKPRGTIIFLQCATGSEDVFSALKLTGYQTPNSGPKNGNFNEYDYRN